MTILQNLEHTTLLILNLFVIYIHRSNVDPIRTLLIISFAVWSISMILRGRELQNKWFLLPNITLSVSCAILVNSQSFLLIRLGFIQNLSWFGVFSFCSNASVFLILSDQVKLFYKLWKSEKSDDSVDEAILNV